MANSNRKHRLALVLGGGGARGAYEAGIIHYIRTKLPKEVALSAHFSLFCGSSVGAITTCFMASTAHDPKLQGQLIYKLWRELKQEDIYKRNLAALTTLLSRSIVGIGRNLLGLSDLTRKHHFSGLLDTSPIHHLLQQVIDWDKIHDNIANRIIDAVSVTATNMNTGHMELFVEKHAELAYTGAYPVHFTQLKPEHARASAAIPIVFPTVGIGDYHYSDGGLRLNTPLSPAIQLGADRLLVIGLHPLKPHTLDLSQQKGAIPSSYPSEAGPQDPPKLGEIAGTVLNSLFLDRIDYDFEQMTRINRLIEWGEMAYGKEFMKKINQMLIKEDIRGDIANRGLKKLKALSIFPSHSISNIFADCLSNPKLMKRYIGAFEKVVLRILDVDLTHGQTFLSYLMFIPEYIGQLLELGFQDAKAHHDELVEFLTTVQQEV